MSFNSLILECFYLGGIFLISLSFTFILIRIFPNIKYLTKNHNGPQKIHIGDVPRLGGITIFLTFFIALLYEDSLKITIIEHLLFIIPVFLLGLIEDITQSVKPKIRLFFSILSGAIFVYVTETSINRLGFLFGDLLLHHQWVSILFTILCILFLIQAFNIIDGLNGLSLSTSISCLSSIAVIALINQDNLILLKSLIIISILLGLLFFNFFGKIFMGDSGAYLIGLLTATTAINLSVNNDNLSPLAIALILIYPSWELIRTIIRRFLNKQNMFSPDANHLHSLLYSNNLNKYRLSALKTNMFTSLQLLFIQLIIFIYVICFHDHKILVNLGIVLFIVFYEIIFRKELKKQSF